MCQKCVDLNIPERLWCNERGINDNFENDSLYRRFNASGDKSTWRANNISHVVFKLEKDSYNRSSLCEKSTDVLYNTRVADNGNHYSDFGILELPCDSFTEINEEINTNPLELNGVKRTFRLEPVHSPLDCMYPHSEIFIYEGDSEVDIKAPKSIGVIMRDVLIDRINIIKEPNIISELKE